MRSSRTMDGFIEADALPLYQIAGVIHLALVACTCLQQPELRLLPGHRFEEPLEQDHTTKAARSSSSWGRKNPDREGRGMCERYARRRRFRVFRTFRGCRVPITFAPNLECAQTRLCACSGAVFLLQSQ